MTAFAACLFAIAALASGWSLYATACRFGPGAAMLRRQLEACPPTMTLEWKSVERAARSVVGEISLPEFRKRPARDMAMALDWPLVGPALELAA